MAHQPYRSPHAYPYKAQAVLALACRPVAVHAKHVRGDDRADFATPARAPLIDLHTRIIKAVTGWFECNRARRGRRAEQRRKRQCS